MEAITYPVVMLLNKISGNEFADNPAQAERVDSSQIIIENSADLELVRTKSIYCTGKLEDAFLSAAEKEDLCNEKNEYYKELLHTLNEDTIDPAVRDTLSFLRKEGYRLAVGSSSKNTKTILQRTKLADYFDAVSDGNNITKSKPDPEVFLKAAEYLFLKPEECFVVEDAEAGIDAAVAGGFCPIGIGPASRYRKTKFPIGKISELKEIAVKAEPQLQK